LLCHIGYSCLPALEDLLLKLYTLAGLRIN